jgi:hypothetical protein
MIPPPLMLANYGDMDELKMRITSSYWRAVARTLEGTVKPYSFQRKEPPHPSEGWWGPSIAGIYCDRMPLSYTAIWSSLSSITGLRRIWQMV